MGEILKANSLKEKKTVLVIIPFFSFKNQHKPLKEIVTATQQCQLHAGGDEEKKLLQELVSTYFYDYTNFVKRKNGSIFLNERRRKEEIAL